MKITKIRCCWSVHCEFVKSMGASREVVQFTELQAFFATTLCVSHERLNFLNKIKIFYSFKTLLLFILLPGSFGD